MRPSSELRAEALIGTVLRRRWTLERVLGTGGQAAVYAATHRNGSRVAIKVLHPSLQIDPVIRSRFLQEGYLANRIGVPDVVKVIDDDAEGDLVYLVMELLEGATIEALRERAGGRLAAADVVEIGCRLLRVLEASHARGVLHRDIKPANLFRTVDPVGFKVLDFGIAQILDAPSAPSGEGKASNEDRFIGTLAFMAPEQVRREEGLDERTDLWAAGATLFTLLTGQHVHPEESATQLLELARERPARPVRDVLAGVPVELAATIDRALAFDRSARFGSAAEMRLACEDCGRALDANGKRSVFFSPRRLSARENPGVAMHGGASKPPVWTHAHGSGVRAVSEPRAGFWSGRVGRLWWFHYSGPCTDETWRQYLEMVERMIDGGQESTLACFAHQAAAPTPIQRRQMADFIKRNRIALSRLDRFALVIDSVVHRHAITALNWLVKKPFEERIFNSPLAALKWLTEKHPELDPETVQASIVGQVPRHSLWPALRSEAAETLEDTALP